MFANLSIGSRLTFIITSITVLILISIGVLAITSSDAALRSQAISRFEGKTAESASAIRNQLDNLYETTQELSLALNDEAMLADAVALRTFLTNFIQTDADELIHQINILRPDGSMAVLRVPNPRTPLVHSWRIYRQDFYMPDDERILNVMETGTTTWARQDDALYDDENRPTITLVAPYFGRFTDQIGILWVDVPIETFQEAVTRILNNEDLLADTVNGYALLVDETGQIITANNAPSDLSTDALNQRTVNLVTGFLDLPEVEEGLYLAETDSVTQVEALLTKTTFSLNNWRFIASLPTDEVPVFPASIIAPIMLVALFGVMFLVWVLNRFVNNAIVHPLSNLNMAAREIGSGDMRYYIGNQQQRDEIGGMARALESMKRNLAHSYDELARLNRTLEQRVEQRTAQLRRAQEAAATNATELRAVYDESLRVVNEVQLQTVLDVFVQRILPLLNASYCGVWLLTEDGERLQLVATNREEEMARTFVLRRGEGIGGQVVERGEPIILDDYTAFPHRVQLGSEKVPLHRALCVPLMFIGTPIGAVVLGRGAEADEFNTRDQQLLTVFANLVSPSVRNAQLLVQRNRAVQEAERANEVKTRFLASVTHELRTPLNLIINNMDFMSIGAFGEITPEQEKRLKQTTRSAEHLLYLVNDLLDVSKIATGEMQLFIQNSDVYTMLEDSIDNTYAFIDRLDDKQDKVQLITDIEEGLPEIAMDVRRIRQVLTNLLTNAVKFTPEGKVSLTVKRVAYGIYFSVEDDGIGIPEDEMGKLFEAFERTQQAKEKQIEGTGLGLPISRYMVQQHSSEIIVESEVGEGSIFKFVLPFELPDENARRTDTQIIAALSSHDR